MPAPTLPSLNTLFGLPLPVQLVLATGIGLLFAAYGAAAVIRALAKYRAAGQPPAGPSSTTPAPEASPRRGAPKVSRLRRLAQRMASFFHSAL